MTVRLTSDVVRVEVSDAGARIRAAGGMHLELHEQSGCVLYLVDPFATRWGVNRGIGTIVWFEISRSAEDSVASV